MPTFETIVAFGFAALLLSISPGPSNLYIMARSINQGFKGGAAASAGMAIGSFIYVIATALGLAAIFNYAPMAYSALKIGGALYLMYLGYRYLTAKPLRVSEAPQVEKKTLISIFYQSIIVELTNPKTALFFMAFLPQFVSSQQGNVTTQFVILGLLYAAIALCCDLFVAGVSGKLGAWMRENPKMLTLQDRFSGSLLLGLGTYIGFQEVTR